MWGCCGSIIRVGSSRRSTPKQLVVVLQDQPAYASRGRETGEIETSMGREAVRVRVAVDVGHASQQIGLFSPA